MSRHRSMNCGYRLVGNHTLNGLVAVAKKNRGRGKGARRKLSAAALALTASLIASLAASYTQAAPVGEQVVAGTGSVSRSGSTTVITQLTPNLALNWAGFNITASETVNFVQPSATAIAVNRIFDTNGTQILGQLNANGQVYLINPNGILFGQGAQVNVGGLVASTLDLNDGSLNGNMRSFSGNGSGSVVNQGTINAANGGYVALLGSHVSNQGVITAQLGSVALGAGSAVTLTFSGNYLVNMQVDQSTLNNFAENGGLIRADGGIVVMSAGAKDALLASVVNNSGVIEARTVESRAGVIILLGGMAAGTVELGGRLDASAPTGGNGGFIETSAAQVKVSSDARITTVASLGLAGNWLIDPVDFTIAATGGNITGATLSSNLNAGNVIIQSVNGGPGTAGNVNVNDVVAWSANKLTLNAYNNININANLNGSGSASLAFEYGQGAIATGNTATYNIKAPVNLPAGDNFSTKLGSDGIATNWKVITDLGAADSNTGTDLQGMGGIANLAGLYVLGADIDASATNTWNGGAGFVPVGDIANAFTGIFDGLGHTISALTINLTTPNVGLFGVTGIGAMIRNVGLLGGSVTGGAGTGGLVGNNGAGNPISNSFTTGSVTGAAGSGGLVGSTTTGAISSSYATGNVSGGAGSGGLVGSNTSGAISNSYATGNVNGAAGTGGLVGSNTSGPISDSYATGNVSGAAGSGGLIGSSTSGLISNTYATGSVAGAAGTGGLIGSGTAGAVSNSYWDTVASGLAISPGGGAGLNSGQMQQQSNFNSWDFTNTWVIYNGITAPLLRALMTELTVTANNQTKTYDRQAYSSGNGVTYSRSLNGGLPAGTLSYSGTSQGAINAGSYLITANGLQSNQQYLITFVSGTLTVNPASLAVTGVTAVSKVYDTSTTAALSGTGTVNALSGDSVSVSAGSGVFADKNVGTGKAVTVNGFTLGGADAGNYTVVQPVGLTANITAANLAVTGVTGISKVYDTSTTAALSGTAAVNALSGDSVSLAGAGSGVFADKNVGTGKAVTVSGFTLGGADAGNYTVVQPVGLTANITAANLAVTGVTGISKVYDTSTTAALSGTAAVNALSGDSVSLAGAGSGVFADKNVGTGKTVTVSGFTLGGADAGNYTVVQPVGLTANITAANLAVTGVTAISKVYDTNTTAALSGTAAVSALSGDSVSLAGAGSGVFADKNVGTGKTVTVSGFTLGGADAGNYTIVQQVGVTANITPATLTYTAAPATAFAGQALGNLSGTVSGFVGGDTQADATAGSLLWTGNASNQPGTFAINGGGLFATNYVFTQAIGNTAALTLIAAAVPEPVSITPPLAASPTLPTSLSWLPVDGLPKPLALSSTIIVVQETSGDAPASDPGNGTVINACIEAGAGGPRLCIMNGGIAPLDNTTATQHE